MCLYSSDVNQRSRATSVSTVSIGITVSASSLKRTDLCIEEEEEVDMAVDAWIRKRWNVVFVNECARDMKDHAAWCLVANRNVFLDFVIDVADWDTEKHSIM